MRAQSALPKLYLTLRMYVLGCKFSGNCLNSGFHEVQIPALLFIFSLFWRLLAHIHTLFQAFPSGQLTSLYNNVMSYRVAKCMPVFHPHRLVVAHTFSHKLTTACTFQCCLT